MLRHHSTKQAGSRCHPPEPVVGEAVTATLTDADGDVTNQAWAWERSPDQEQLMWSTITRADGATYTPVSDDAGRLLRAMVSYDDAVGMGRMAVSEATAAVDQRGCGDTVAYSSRWLGEVCDGDADRRRWRHNESGMAVGEVAWARASLEWSAISGAESLSYMPTSTRRCRETAACHGGDLQ